MTEQLIRHVADALCLGVFKRVTTGNSQKHFAMFELSGPVESLNRAWDALRPELRHNLDGKYRVDNPEHHDHGLPYIELQSVWCELDI